MKKWLMRNLVCRFIGHLDGVRMPIFVPWNGFYDDDPYWDNIKSQIEENRKRSIPVCQNPGNGGICHLQMFHDGPCDYVPESGVATAMNETLDYTTPTIYRPRERGTIHCKRCSAMVGDY